MLMTFLYALHWFAALLIALQSVDRIYQCPLRKKGLCIKDRSFMALKGIAWTLLAAASLGALVGPMFRGYPLWEGAATLINPQPSLAEIFLFVGFAVLIVRSWIKEIAHYRCCKHHPSNVQKNPVSSAVLRGGCA